MKSPHPESSKIIAKILCESGSIIFRPSAPFRFTSGILSPIYVDNRRLISLPKERRIVTNNFVKVVKKIGVPDAVAGTATAGIPHAAWIAEALKIPMVYVRSEPKKHGRKNQVEGIIKRGQKVIVIEDLVSTAGSSINTIKALRKLGAKVTHEIAIYSHGLTEAQKNFAKAKVKLISLTNLTNVLDFAKKYSYLRAADQATKVLEWAKDPKGWGKRMGFE